MMASLGCRGTVPSIGDALDVTEMIFRIVFSCRTYAISAAIFGGVTGLPTRF